MKYANMKYGKNFTNIDNMDNIRMDNIGNTVSKKCRKYTEKIHFGGKIRNSRLLMTGGKKVSNNMQKVTNDILKNAKNENDSS